MTADLLSPLGEPRVIGIDLAKGPDETALQLAVSGIVKHSEVRIDTGGGAHLVVVVLQHTGALPVVAMLHGQRGDAVQMEAMAIRLRHPGAIALLRGEGLRLKPTTPWGGPALELERCFCVSELDVQPTAPGAY